MSIEQRAEPCWVLHLTNDDEVHCDAEEAANQWLTPDIAHLYDRVALADQPCWIARCNTCGGTEEGEDGNTMHYAAASEHEAGDLVANPDGTHTCSWCRTKCPCTGYTAGKHGDPWCTCGHQHARHSRTGDCTVRIGAAA